ncbi:MAG: hypothetical protein LBH95_02295 [Oscillospiraceae bacterium]|jgi:hypothetical protein|nr:hypothetical protein [Oscillospiraceae bacterium]
MDNSIPNQSFGVDDIRRIREEADERYQHMTREEIAAEIREGSQEFRRLMEEIRAKKAEGQPLN